jgi:hypothetical protein
MQTRGRRSHGIKSKKISISVSEGDLKILVGRARRLHRGNLSAVVHDMIADLARGEAADALLRDLGGERVSEAEMEAIRKEITAGSRSPTTARRSRIR